MIHVFEAGTADEVWVQAARRFDSLEDMLYQQSRAGPTYELLHTCLSIGDPRQRWILSRKPAINPAFAIAEVVWILAGRNDAAFLNHWNPALPRYAGSNATYYGAYGHRLRRNFGVDQLEQACHTLAQNPDSRQVVLQFWDPSLDLPRADGKPRSQDIPCNVCSMLKVRGGRLEWMQVLRSNDLFLGVPHNVIQFTSLQEVIAGWLGVHMGPYHQLSDSLHLYERDRRHIRWHGAAELPRNTDSLMLPKPESDRIWQELEERMNVLAKTPQLPFGTWNDLITGFEAPMAFQNLLRVVAADDARRRGWIAAAVEAMQKCSNPLLSLAWERWLLRKTR